MPGYVALRCFPVVAAMGLFVEGEPGTCVQATGFVSKGQVVWSRDFVSDPRLLKLLRPEPWESIYQIAWTGPGPGKLIEDPIVGPEAQNESINPEPQEPAMQAVDLKINTETTPAVQEASSEAQDASRGHKAKKGKK